MRLITEFSKSGNYTAWESGGFNPQQNSGWAVLIGSAEAAPLEVIYENDLKASKKHFLFFVSVGCYVVNAFVSLMKHSTTTQVVRIEIGKITELSNSPVSKTKGRKFSVTAEHKTDLIWSHSKLVDTRKPVQRTDVSIHHELCKEPIEVINRLNDMLEAAYHKALATSDQQKLFWGNARRPRDTKAPDTALQIPVNTASKNSDSDDADEAATSAVGVNQLGMSDDIDLSDAPEVTSEVTNDPSLPALLQSKL